MKVLNSIPDKNFFRNPVVTIGNFDGVHIGHQRILSEMVKLAMGKKGESIVLTFFSHPRRFINPDINLKHLTSINEKIKIIEKYDIDYLVFLDFSQDIADLNALEFYNNYLVDKIGARDIVIGYDHAFGKNREGNIGFLMKLSESSGIGITRVEEVILDSLPVSSTWLRDEISKGNMDVVTKLLGRNYEIQGSVIRGAERGKSLGFPTANISPFDTEKLIPGDGVYAVSVIIDGYIHKQGMTNIGFNPTFNESKRSIETNIFDFDGDLYDKSIIIQFFKKLRGEIKFESPVELKNQIERDRVSAINLMKK